MFSSCDQCSANFQFPDVPARKRNQCTAEPGPASTKSCTKYDGRCEDGQYCHGRETGIVLSGENRGREQVGKQGCSGLSQHIDEFVSYPHNATAPPMSPVSPPGMYARLVSFPCTFPSLASIRVPYTAPKMRNRPIRTHVVHRTARAAVGNVAKTVDA